MTGEKDFWSRRKAKVREAEEQELIAREAENETSQLAELEEKTDQEILTELELPDPDELQRGDDFTAFMRSTVPERLRRRALRRLWQSNPVLANVDGLIDYGDDFTDKATVIENLQTTYQVGKGMLKHVMEMAEKAKREGDEAEIETGDSSFSSEHEEKTPEIVEETLTADVDSSQTASMQVRSGTPERDGMEDVVPESEESPLSRRRMQFAFNEQ